MSERLTDEELDALIARFSPGRHPKVAAALAELLEFRGGERQRAMDGLLDGVATAVAGALAKKVEWEVTAGTRATVPLIRETPLEMSEPSRATNRRVRREATIRVRKSSPLARRLSEMNVFGESFTLGGDARLFGLEPFDRWTVVRERHDSDASGNVVTTFDLWEVEQPTEAQ